mgnify:CR=1 FL=1
MSTSANHGPIEARHIELMNAVAKGLDDVFNGKDCPKGEKKVGFFLTVFNFDDEAGRFNYISNADKLDVRAMLTDVLARIEGRLHETTARN